MCKFSFLFILLCNFSIASSEIKSIINLEKNTKSKNISLYHYQGQDYNQREIRYGLESLVYERCDVRLAPISNKLLIKSPSGFIHNGQVVGVEMIQRSTQLAYSADFNNSNHVVLKHVCMGQTNNYNLQYYVNPEELLIGKDDFEKDFDLEATTEALYLGRKVGIQIATPKHY